MQKFKSCLSTTIAELKDPSNRSQANLEECMSKLTLQTEPIVAGAPERIKDLYSSAFESCEWDPKSHNPRTGKTINAHACLDAIQNLLSTMQESSTVVPTKDEIDDFSLAVNRLWSLDVRRLVPSLNYEVNTQKGKSSWSNQDVASNKLFTYVDETLFEQPSYKSFIKLLDNYNARLGFKESVTSQELQEEDHFIDLVLDTACGAYLTNYLVAKKKIQPNRASFHAALKEAWFGLYRRDEGLDSSGFEHVFVGEITDEAKVSGLHNWIQMYFEEKKGRLDYQGFIKPKRGMDGVESFSKEQFLNIQFIWDGHLKPESSSFIGTSPEFEFCLFSLAFFMDREKSIVQCGPHTVAITVYDFTSRGRKYIGSAFPEAPRDDYRK